MLGLTAIGRAGAKVPDRSGGKPGDGLWLVGYFGDAGAGLEQLRADKNASGPLVDAYRRPVPLLAAGQALAPHAHAMMDVSDGLLLDARRMAEASGCSAVIDLDSLPLSDAFKAARGDDQRRAAVRCHGGRRLRVARRASGRFLNTLFTFGDDNHQARETRRWRWFPSTGQRRETRHIAGEIGP